MLHKRPARRVSLSELLGRGFMQAWLERRSTAPPPLLDLLEQKQAALQRPFPDCYAWGRGARLPRLREDLIPPTPTPTPTPTPSPTPSPTPTPTPPLPLPLPLTQPYP